MEGFLPLQLLESDITRLMILVFLLNPSSFGLTKYFKQNNVFYSFPFSVIFPFGGCLWSTSCLPVREGGWVEEPATDG